MATRELFLSLPPNPFAAHEAYQPKHVDFASPARYNDFGREDSFALSVLNLLEDDDQPSVEPAPRRSSPALRSATQELAKELGLPAPRGDVPSKTRSISPPSAVTAPGRAVPGFGFGQPRTVSPGLPSPASDRAASPGATSPGAGNVLWLGDLDAWMMEEGYLRRCIRSAGWDVNLNRGPGEPTVVDVGIKLSQATSSLSGYCFLTFPTAAHAAAVMQLYESKQQRTLMPGSERTFKLNWATGEPGSLPVYQSEYSIFVADLVKEATEGELVALFAPIFPSCRAAKIMYDSSTGQHKGYAFVRFSDAGECQRALALGRNPTGTGLTLRGRPLRISEASSTGSGSVRRAESPLPSPALNRPGYFRQTTADGQDSAVSYASGPVSSYPFPEPRSRPQHFQPSRDIHSPLPRSPTGNIPPPVLADLLNELHEPENSTIFVGNLPSSISEDLLMRHFHHFGEVVYVKVPPGRNCGFVQYSQREDAELAMTKMQGYPILGSARLRLSWARNPSDKVMEHVRKLSQALAIPFEEVYKMVQGTDRSLIKQFANAVGPNGYAPSLAPVTNVASVAPFGAPDRYSQVSAKEFASPASSYRNNFRRSSGSTGMLSPPTYGTPSSFMSSPSSSTGSPYGFLSDGFSNLSITNSPASLTGSPVSFQSASSPSCHSSKATFGTASGVVGFL